MIKDEPAETALRINRFLSDRGVCSRRQADKFIQEQRVSINGKVAVLGDKILPGDRIKVDSKPVSTDEIPDILLAYYKPRGIECTTDPSVKENIVDAVGYPTRVFPIGRLDKMSEGLILMTNRGEITEKLLRSEGQHEKEYIVYLNASITEDQVRTMARGMRLFIGGRWIRTLPCKVKLLKNDVIAMTLIEGKNRQIRRMLEVFDIRPKRLKRIRIMNIRLGEIPLGEFRKLKRSEVQQLRCQLGAHR